MVEEIRGLIGDSLKAVNRIQYSEKQTRECTTTSGGGRGDWIKIIEEAHKSHADLMREIEAFGEGGGKMILDEEQS